MVERASRSDLISTGAHGDTFGNLKKVVDSKGVALVKMRDEVTDAADTWVRDTAYETDIPFSWRPTQASAVDINGKPIPQNELGLFAYPEATTGVGTTHTSLNATAPTIAEFALMEYTGPAPATVESDPVFVAAQPALALKTELHDGAAQDAAIALKADQTALAAEIASTDAEQTAQDAAITAETTRATAAETALDASVALRELVANKQIVIPVDGVADNTNYPTSKAVRDAIEALNFSGVYQGSATTVATIPVGANGDWGILNTVDGVNPIGIYVTDGTTYTLAKSLPDFALLTQAQITSTTGAEYTEAGIVSAERLDAWGTSRRVQRIFHSATDFDFSALGYADRTAVYVRNTNAINGIGIIYGAGGSNTRELTYANGLTESVAGQDSFNLQPLEIAFMEKEGTAVRASIIPAERVAAKTDYANANAEGPYPHDAIVLVRDTGELFFRRTGANNVPFPLDGQQNVDWWIAGDKKDPQSLILDYILVNVRSSGTNASSSVGITFTDNDGNDYPHADWVYSADLLQYAGGTATIVTDKAAWSGTLGIGHNKQGPVKFYYIGDNPNGISAIVGTGANGGETQDVSVEYQGTNYSDTFASTGAVSGPLYWTTSQQVEATDQAAPLVDATEYLANSVFSAPEPDNTDPDYQTWFNWRVNDGETIADTDVPTGTEAELLAIKPKLTRFGIGSTTGVDWLLVGNTDPFQKGVVNYQKNPADTGVAPTLSPNEDYAVARKNAQGTYDYTQYFHDGDGVQTIENAAASTKWVYSTDGMNAVDGDKIIVAPNHTINMPDVTDLSSIEFAPSTGNWSDIFAGTGGFNPDAAWTVGLGQTLPFGSDVLRAISNLGTTNWLLFTGGEDVPSQDERVDTVANLPLATSVNSGSVRVIYNDPTAANNRPWVAFGPAGTTAVGWQ